MSEVKHARHQTENEVVIERAKDFWSKYNRLIVSICGAIIILGGGYLTYKYLIQEPKEQKAKDAIFKAEDYFQKDSLKQAVQGDGQYPGFEREISQYGGTEAGNLAKYYAGASYLKLGDNTK